MGMHDSGELQTDGERHVPVEKKLCWMSTAGCGASCSGRECVYEGETRCAS
jgi:hypothetical protein